MNKHCLFCDHNRLVWGLASGGILIVLLIVAALIFHKPIENMIFTRKIASVEHRIHGRIIIRKTKFEGLKKMNFYGIQVLCSDSSSFVTIDSVKVKIALLPALTGHLKLRDLYVSGLNLRLVKNDKGWNFQLLAAHEPQIQSSSEPAKPDFRRFTSGFVKLLFSELPGQWKIENSRIHFILERDSSELYTLEPFVKEKEQFTGRFGVKPDSHHSCLALKGVINEDTKTLSVTASGLAESSFPMPEQIWNLSVGFDSVTVSLIANKKAKDMDRLTALCTVHALHIKQPRLAEGTISVDHATAGLQVGIGPGEIEIDSTSLVSVNAITFHPYILYRDDPSKTYVLQVLPVDWDAATFFPSLPAGFFDLAREIRSQGTLHYALLFSANMDRLDSLRFESKLTVKKFSLTSWGRINPYRYNDTFQYDIYKDGVYIRSLTVGPQNPHYTPLGAISPFLVNTVLTSEDGGFMYHNGFNPEAFREALIKDIREKRFARGGSTISMQLVKNLFLNKNKNIARKAEEAMLVWFLEHQRVMTKERMLEVYLNIIEWGPNVYGIGEASRYYFNKKPADLTLSESLFLAEVIPHPKSFYRSFDESGNLKASFNDYKRLVLRFMLRRGLITENDTAKTGLPISLTGPAKDFLMHLDTIPAVSDSLEIEPDEPDLPDFPAPSEVR